MAITRKVVRPPAAEVKPKRTISIDFAEAEENLAKSEESSKYESPLIKSIVNSLESNKKITRLTFQEDPSVASSRYSGLYYDKVSLLPDILIKRIRIVDDLIAAITLGRAHQCAPFGNQLQDRFSYGFRIEPDFSSGFDKLSEEKKQEIKDKIPKIEKRLATCGGTSKWNEEDQMSLSTFLHLQAANAVTFGRFATDIIWGKTLNGEKKFYAFRPVDPGTIHKAVPAKEGDPSQKAIRKRAFKLLEQITGKKLNPEKNSPDEYAWFQVINGSPVNVYTSDEMIVHNCYPNTDIELNGYPVTPIDSAVSAITTHINITNHNKLYFQNGRSAKGMLVIQSDDVDGSTLGDIKQQFVAAINSVSNAHRMPIFKVGKEDDIQWKPIDTSTKDGEFQYLVDQNARVILSAFQMSPDELPGYGHLSKGTNNQALCLSPESLIYVPEGFKSIESVLNGQDSVDTHVWTGTLWAPATVFKTGAKELVTTKLDNGISLDTSPDHRFKVIGEEGEPVWKHQKDLKVGDFVLTNKKIVEGIGQIPEYEGKKLTSEMMEVLGWLTGDGNINKRKKQSVLSFFYHHEKELDIWERHNQFMIDFGLTPKHIKKEISTEAAEKAKTRYGFKNIAPFRITNKLYDTKFINWLYSIGFQSSTEGKVIPSFIYTLPEEYRTSFLRGLFSADGHKSSSRGVTITIHDEKLREQTKKILLSLGIRTALSEGVSKQIFVNEDKRAMVKGASRLFIKDRVRFFEKIGFLQAHKQPDPKALEYSRGIDKLPVATQIKYAKLLLEQNFSKKIKNNLHTVINQKFNRGITCDKIVELLKEANLPVPEWMLDYHFDEVVEIVKTGKIVEMADLTVHTKEHAFIAEGILVHNSESSNEYKLEAARDVGLRPLLSHLQGFLNSRILPLMDEEIAKYCTIKLHGLDAETPDKELTRIQGEMATWATYDDVLVRVEKKPLGKEWGGEFPLNPAIQMVFDKFFKVGEIREHFFNRKGDSQDPNWDYVRDQFWFQKHQELVQIEMQARQEQMMAQQQQQAMQQQAQQGQGGQNPQQQPQQQDQGSEIASGVDQLLQSLAKGEQEVKTVKSKLDLLHEDIIKSTMDDWFKQSQKEISEITALISKN